MIIPTFLSSVPPWAYLALGGAVGWVKSFWNTVYDHTIGVITRKIQVMITIEEQEHQEAFVWVNMWMEKHLRNRKIVSLRLQSKYEDDDSYELVPSYGFYWLFWNHKLLTFNSEKKDPAAGDQKAMAFRRSITMTIWGTRDRDLLLDVLLKAKEEFKQQNPKRLRYYTHYTDWWDSNLLTERKIETIYLPEIQLQDILSDFKSFFESKEKYGSLGIPWRKGYLLEGPPGTGKSSLVQALSTHFQIPIYYLNITGKTDGSGLMGLIRDTRSPSILLMEDVDCVKAAQDREKEDNKEKPALQTSELLNLLDGLVASEGRIVIMTTNHPDKLDAALLRSGRVDRRFHIGFAEDRELRRFHSKAAEYYPVPEFSIFRKSLPEKTTLADAQNQVFLTINHNFLDKNPLM